MKTEELLKQIGELFSTNPKEADRLYNEEYLPLVKRQNAKMRKELKEAL